MGATELPAGRNEHSELNRQLHRRNSEHPHPLPFDSNIIGIVFCDPGGAIRDANDSFLRMVGYERADLASGELHWADLTPPEWLERDRQYAERQVSPTTSVQPYEQELFRKDGGRVRVLLERSALDDESKDGFAIVVDITSLRRAEEELRRSQQYLAEAQKVSHTGSWAWSPVSNAILYWSEECYRVFGLDPTLGPPSFDDLAERIHPDDRTETLVRCDRYTRAGNDFELEQRLLLPDGLVRNVRIIAHPVRNASGAVTEFVGTVVDVTEQKRAEEARRQHRVEARLQTTLNMIPAYTWYANPAGALTFANERCANYSGLPNDHPHRFGIETGAAWDSHIPLLHPDDHDETRRVWSTCLATGSAGEVSFRVRDAQGAYRWFLSRAEPLRAKDGTLLYWIGINLDIEERKKAELYLAEAQRLSHTGSWAWSPVSNTILYWSDECYRILGYDPAQGLPSFDSSLQRIHPEDRPALTETIERAVREKAEFQIDYRLVLPDGTQRNVHIQSHPVLDASGKPVEFVGTVMDITEQRRAEQERRAHLWFLESMDRINRAMQRSNNLELMIGGVLEEALLIFGCDRVSLLYPCDPDSPTVRAVMEHTRPEYPGAFVLGEELPLDAAGSGLLRSVLLAPGAVENPVIPPRIRERLTVQSTLTIAVRPKGDRPYLLGLHQCSHARAWTAAERRLFEEITRRLEDALTSVLAYRNVGAREKELRRSQHYLAEAQKLTRTGSWAWNPFSNEILYWSEECYRILDFDPALGIPSFESVVGRIHSEDRPEVLEAAEKAVAEKAIMRLEYRVILPGGLARTHRLLTHPVLNASGELIEYLGTVMDATEQKWAEEERKEHVWFLECMDRINRAIQRTNDVEGMMQGVLEETLATLGLDRAWLIYPCDPDTEFFRVVMEQTRPEYPTTFSLDDEIAMSEQRAENLRRVLAGPGAVTDLFVPQEGRERFGVQSVIAIAVRPKGDRPYLLALHQCSHARVWNAAECRLSEEIARRLEDALTSMLAHRNLVAREEELRRSRAYLAEAQKVSHTGSWAWNNETREFAYWSEECFRIHGRNPSQGIPSLVQILADIQADDAREYLASMDELHEGRELEGQYRMVNFADGPRTVRTVGHPVLDRSGRVVEYIGTVVDITKQKRAERALRASELERARAQRALREAREKLAQASKIASLAELSASIAHEINQPLQAIVANGHASLRWLDAIPPNIEKAIRTAQRVVRDGNDAAEIVSRIRALFKHAAPAKVDLDVNLLIMQVCTLMADEIQGSGVSLETELDEDLPTIKADAVQIQQVVVNLVRNAVEAMVETRRNPLLIRSRRSAGHVAVDVRDQGTGLGNLEKIFEPFVTTKQTGMGMGLAICRSIIEAHAGEITVVHNQGPGVTFSFSLPRDSADAT